MRLNSLLILVCLVIIVYYPLFLFGKIPIPADAMTGAFYPWIDYKWGYEVGVPVKNSTLSDVYSAFYVWKNLSIDLMKNFQWPLWNQYSSSGTPLLGSYQAAHFFPFNILLLLPRNLGWGLFIFGQTFVAALGMYFLLSIYTKNALAKVTSAIVFSLSGFMGTWVEFGNGVWAAACLPWIFYGLEKFWQKEEIRYLVLFFFFFASLYLAGLAQMIVFASGFFTLYLIFKLVVKEIRLSQVFLPFVFWLGALGVASIEVLPALDLANQSIRSSEAYAKQFNFGLTPFFEFIRVWAADFFGNPATYNEWSKLTYFEHSIFLGTLTLPLILSLFWRQLFSKGVIFYGFIFLGSIFLALDTPITRALYSIPFPLLTYSSSGRILFITSFAAAILVGLSIVELQKSREFRKNFLIFTSVLFVMMLCIAGGVLFNIIANSPNSKNLIVSLKNLIVPLMILIFAIVLSTISLKLKRKLIIIFPLIIIGLLYLDLTRYFLKYNPFVSQNLIFPTTPVIDFLQRDKSLFRIVRTDERLFPTNTWLIYKISSIEGYDPMALENYNRFFNIVNDNSYKSSVSRFAVAKKFRDNFLDALNVKYFLSIKDTDIDKQFSRRYKKVFEDKKTVVYENDNFLNRAYFVPKLVSVEDREKLIKKIDDKFFNPKLKAVVIGGQSMDFPSDGEILIDLYSQERVQITTKANGPRFLVLADAYEKNWNLYINGQESNIYQINGALRGVIVPEGNNKLEFSYWPKSLEWGIKIATFSLVAITFLTIYYGYKGRRQK